MPQFNLKAFIQVKGDKTYHLLWSFQQQEDSKDQVPFARGLGHESHIQ